MEDSITMTDNFRNVCDLRIQVEGLKACMERPRWNKQDDNLKDWLYRSNNILALLLRLQSRSDNKKESKYIILESLLRYINNTKNCNRFPDTVIAPVIRRENETDILVQDNEKQVFVINLTTTDTCNLLDSPEEEQERHIRLSFREDIIDWLETEVINIMPSIEYSLAKGIYQYYECLIKMFNLDNKQDFKVILDTGLQKTRKLREEKICIFEKRAKTKQKDTFKMIFDTELQKRRKMFEEKICIFEQRAKTLFENPKESDE